MQITKSFYRKLGTCVNHGDMVICEKACAIVAQNQKNRHKFFRVGDMFIMGEAFMESPLLDPRHRDTSIWIRVIKGDKVYNLDGFAINESFRKQFFMRVKV